MDIQEFNRRIRQQAQQISGLLNRRMPVLAGNIAKRHIEEDFRKGGFTGGGFHRWKETRRQRGGGNSAASQYGPLLSGRNHLSGSINFRPGNRLVRVYTNVPYAAVHNSGGTLHPAVTPQMRKFAWAMHYKTAGRKKGRKKEGKKRTPPVENAPEEVLMWKRLALTPKKRLNVRIPKRQFMPDASSSELEQKIRDKFDAEIKRIIHQ